MTTRLSPGGYINKYYNFIGKDRSIFNGLELIGLSPYFNDLPLDHHLNPNQGMFRRRKYSELRLIDTEIELLSDVESPYEALDAEMMAERGFQKLIASFVSNIPPSDRLYRIGVHQIRVFCDPTQDIPEAFPNPGGVHQDGMDFVGIFVVERYNVAGGETFLSLNRNTAPLFSDILDSGDLLIFDDKQCWHSTAQIFPIERGFAYRDVFVLTAKA